MSHQYFQYLEDQFRGHKCLYPVQKFDSDPERRFAVLLENDGDVVKWFKLAKGDFQIHYSHEDSYEPDFVVETKTAKFLCEPKRASEMTDDVVLAKADASTGFCASWPRRRQAISISSR